MRITVLLFLATLTLAGCKSEEEKAADYFASGQTLISAGDTDRGLVELRNVFTHAPFHKEARKLYADTLVARGEVVEAYSQYLRLIEQYPDTADVRQILADLAIQNNDWEEAERHGREAIRLAPGVAAVEAIRVALDYRAAVVAKDDAARATLAAEAQALLATLPDSAISRRIVIDQLVQGPSPADALPMIEEALSRDPKSLEYHMMKFLLLAQTNQAEATGEQLKTMFNLFPDNAEVRSSLIGWYMAAGDHDGAEAFLRTLAGAPTENLSYHLGLIQFLQKWRGSEVARGELSALIEANKGGENAQMYASLLASMDYDAGNQPQAITALQAILATAQPSDQTRGIKAMLARMLDATGNRVGARALVEEVLTEDRTNPSALKLRATWGIAGDSIDTALLDLNTALEKAPRDPEVFTLLALAQERGGNPDRTGELLAKAVETSGAAPAESLRYAAFLNGQSNARLAETTLTTAWRLAPDNPDLLRALADLFISQLKWTQAQTAVDLLNKLPNPDTILLQAAILSGQNRADEALALLKDHIAKTPDASQAVMAVVQTHSNLGQQPEARAYIDTLLAKSPEDRNLRLLAAGLDAQLGLLPQAIATYRDLIASDPADEPPVRLLHDILAASGQRAEATAVLDAGLVAQPDARSLRFLKAGEAERDGEIEQAITLYEGLYAEDSTDIVVANNLASLLASYRDDTETLKRAEAIARRLRGNPNPAFQDTYGWIAFRNDNNYGALAHLEPAARGLPEDALTQVHLAMLYEKMGRDADAVAQFDRALTLAAKSGQSGLPQMKLATSRRDALQAKRDGGNP
jgi:cellulose synthase operon protein C